MQHYRLALRWTLIILAVCLALGVSNTYGAPSAAPGKMATPTITLGDGTVVLTWVAPTSSQPVTGYELQYQEAPKDSETHLNILRFSGDQWVRTEHWNDYALDGTATTVTINSLPRNSTHVFRIRGVDSTGSGPWSNNFFAVAASFAMGTPHGVGLSRSDNGSDITIGWTTPLGNVPVTAYSLQRQEIVDNNAGNVINVSSAIAASATSYDDTGLAAQTVYEYRIAAIGGGVVGPYSEWFRSFPRGTRYADAPEMLRVEERIEHHDDGILEFWAEWDTLEDTTDYQVELRTYPYYTDEDWTIRQGATAHTRWFGYTYGRADVRVRGRKQDTTQCGAGDLRCYSDWSAWLQLPWVPKLPEQEFDESAIADNPDTATQEFRQDLEGAITSAIEPIGFANAEAGNVLNAGWVVMIIVAMTFTFWIGRRRGMTPLGAGMAAAVGFLLLMIGIELIALPIAWGVMAAILIFGAGASAGLSVLRGSRG